MDAAMLERLNGQRRHRDPLYGYTTLNLDHDGSGFVDRSAAAATISASGSPVPAGTLERSVVGRYSSRHGGGSGILLSSRSSAIGTGPFCMEAWVFPTSAVSGRAISAQSVIDSPKVVAMRVDAAGSLQLFARTTTGGSFPVSAAGLIGLNRWSHICFERLPDAAGTLLGYVGGQVVATGAFTTSLSVPVYGWCVGAFAGSDGGVPQEVFVGDINGARITEGRVRYGGAFTPPRFIPIC